MSRTHSHSTSFQGFVKDIHKNSHKFDKITSIKSINIDLKGFSHQLNLTKKIKYLVKKRIDEIRRLSDHFTYGRILNRHRNERIW
jgi:hypothetical protein